MKIVVLSDTHLDHVTDELESVCGRYCADADLVIHLGDWVGGAVLDYLEQFPLEGVAGNMDNHVIRHRLPAKKVIQVGGYRIGLIHGWGSGFGLQARIRDEFSNVDAICFGHSHQALQEVEGGLFWLNPGSLFMGRGKSARTLGILYAEDSLRAEIVTL